MSAQAQKGFMLIFRGTNWHEGLSPEQMQQVMDQWMAWFSRLKDEGKVLTGSPLESEIRVVSGKSGRVTSDGPFAEAKEMIGGYFLAKVDSFDDAVAIARQCPGLPHGIQVEVRQMANECPAAAELRQEQHATAVA